MNMTTYSFRIDESNKLQRAFRGRKITSVDHEEQSLTLDNGDNVKLIQGRNYFFDLVLESFTRNIEEIIVVVTEFPGIVKSATKTVMIAKNGHMQVPVFSVFEEQSGGVGIVFAVTEAVRQPDDTPAYLTNGFSANQVDEALRVCEKLQEVVKDAFILRTNEHTQVRVTPNASNMAYYDICTAENRLLSVDRLGPEVSTDELLLVEFARETYYFVGLKDIVTLTRALAKVL